MRVRFHFDPMCPWAYRTSLWIREVRDRAGIDLDWAFFSLEEVNREEAKPHPWERRWSYGWSQLRVAALLRRRGGDEVDRWYREAGAALHDRGERPFTEEGARAVLSAIGLDPDLVGEALDDPTTTDEVRTDHEDLVRRFGGHGVPTLVLDDRHALFGPVLLHPPTGEAAVRLWELVSGWTEFPDLYELRRPKTADDVAAIEAAFQPYLAARAWRTVQRPAV